MARPKLDLRAEAQRIRERARREQGPPSEAALDLLAELLDYQPSLPAEEAS